METERHLPPPASSSRYYHAIRRAGCRAVHARGAMRNTRMPCVEAAPPPYSHGAGEGW